MPEDIFSPHMPMDLARCLAVYETLRGVTPAPVPKAMRRTARLRELFDQLDAVLLDGFGVLNVGAEAVPGSDKMLAAAAAEEVAVMVVTNGASRPKRFTGDKYRQFGLVLDDRQIVSSRDALLDWLDHGAGPGLTIGVVDSFAIAPDSGRHVFIALDPANPRAWQQVDAIAFFGAVDWDLRWQAALEDAVQTGVQLFVANPDVAAPHADGFSFEPGYWTAAARGIAGDQIRWFGKPHAPVFDLAIRKLEEYTGRSNWNRKRIAMVGDSLHTDILGGNAAGLMTVLVTDHGMFRDGGAEAAISSTGITPDVIVRTV